MKQLRPALPQRLIMMKISLRLHQELLQIEPTLGFEVLKVDEYIGKDVGKSLCRVFVKLHSVEGKRDQIIRPPACLLHHQNREGAVYLTCVPAYAVIVQSVLAVASTKKGRDTLRNRSHRQHHA
jgi:hypothetical protein